MKLWPFTSGASVSPSDTHATAGSTPAKPASASKVPKPPPPPRRVAEDFLELSTPPLDTLVSPFFTASQGMTTLFPLFPVRRLSTGYSNYVYLTQPQLDLLRWFGRISYELNEYARAALTHLANYTVGSGYEYSAVPLEGENPSKDLLKLVNRFLRKFREKNCWVDHEWERNLYTEARRDGDVFVRFDFDDESGIPRIRKYLGEEVRDEKFYTPEWTFGVLTDLQDPSRPKGWQVWQRTSDNLRTEVLQQHEMIRLINHLSPENSEG